MTDRGAFRLRFMSALPTTARGFLGAFAIWIIVGFLLEFPSSLGISMNAFSHMLLWPLYIGLRLLRWVILIGIVAFVVRVLFSRTSKAA